MAEFELRPMSTGELLDRSFRLYREHFVLFAGLMALPAMFECGTTLFVQLVAGLGSDTIRTKVALIGTLANVGRLYAYGLAAGLTSIAAGGLWMGRPGAIRDIYSQFLMHLDSLTYLYILAGVGMIGLGLATSAMRVAATTLLVAVGAQQQVSHGIALIMSFAIAITGFYVLAVRYGAAVPALLFEDLVARESLGRSATLTRGHRGRVFLILLLMTVIIYAAVILFEVPVAVVEFLMPDPSHVPFWVSVLRAMATSVGSIVSLPIPIIALVLLYYDIRIRTEGFDLQVMIAALKPPTPASLLFPPHGGP